MGNKNERIKAQVSLEFSAAFIVLLILLIATTKLFVWFGNNIVERHRAYEATRRGQVLPASTPTPAPTPTPGPLPTPTPVASVSVPTPTPAAVSRQPPPEDFYRQSEHPLNIFGGS